MTGCFDSDVLIDYFDGIAAAADELSRYQRILVSRISWMEVLVGAPTDLLRQVREDFLRQFTVIELDERVAREAITLRQAHKLKLPDAIYLGFRAPQPGVADHARRQGFRPPGPGNPHSL